MTVSYCQTEARLALLALCMLLSLPEGSSGADSAGISTAYLRLNTCREESTITGNQGITPAEGNILVCGTFNDSSFSAGSISEIRISSNGQTLPVLVDKKSILTEFDRIISVSVCFQVPEDTSPDSLTLEWGPGISASNSLTDIIISNHTATNLLRSFNWTQKKESSDSSIASIEVIADSYSSYHSLWYILPMAVIFAVLTLRKHTSDK